jgi:hypothetical protein
VLAPRNNYQQKGPVVYRQGLFVDSAQHKFYRQSERNWHQWFPQHLPNQVELLGQPCCKPV